MKKNLLYSVLTLMLITSVSVAQTKVWDFGNDDTTWPLGSGIGNSPIVVDNLGLYPIATNTNFGAVTTSNTSFSDGFTAPRRFQMNGGGGVTAPTYMPIQRYLFFDVDGACTITVWFKTGSNGTQRSILVTDGTNLIGSAMSNNGTNGDNVILTTNYTNATGGRIYVYGDAACNLYKMEVTGASVSATLSSDSFNNKLTAKAYGADNKIHLSNIISETKVNVYSLTGQLVKSLNTSSDTNFELNKGFYIVNMESNEGRKSVKVIL